jgi:ketosteroid isomerase-like protein
MHTNARLIETLYSAIRAKDANAIAPCYATDASFKDIAFDLKGREMIRNMWRMICDSDMRVLECEVESADDRRGTGTWHATYTFNAKEKPPGRPVDNTLCSEFGFRDGLILRHEDKCDVGKWADQAIAFPWNYPARIRLFRKREADRKLKRFISENRDGHLRPG